MGSISLRRARFNRWEEREELREKGQFWTPDWVAEAMVAYTTRDSLDLFDPAVGSGAFFLAARALGKESGRRIHLRGYEIDAAAIEEAKRNGLTGEDLAAVVIGDFLRAPIADGLTSVVANPPYVRHHRLSANLKGFLREIAARTVGKPLDGRAGLHVFFLLRALSLLRKGGRLCFIVPADTCEGVFASALWRWIGGRYRLDAVVTFEPDASPFRRVDTNPVILMIRNSAPTEELLWARCLNAETDDLKGWALSDFSKVGPHLHVERRSLAEGLRTGLTREPAATDLDVPRLGDFAKVMRGIATGANDFFHLTASRVEELGIPDGFLVPSIGRTRDLLGEEILPEHLKTLDSLGRPTLLFAPDKRPLEKFPAPVRAYLKTGQTMGLPARPLIAQRRPWYKMETRLVPPILFAYLGRRNVRFVRNRADVRPLTGFLCVYPHDTSDPTIVDRLWLVLSDPRTEANLRLVGKSYGGGAIKVEPRALECLPLPADLLEREGLRSSDAKGRRPLFT